MSTKRLADLAIALLLLPFAAPIVLATIAAIRATSPGPAIFRQTRVGLNERPFTCYKLRTMYADTRDAPQPRDRGRRGNPRRPLAAPAEARRAAAALEHPARRHELRGPPPLPSRANRAHCIAPRARPLRHPPGITGVAQVAGVDMSDPDRLAALDATYLTDMSLGRDLRLLVATALGAGRGDRVRT